MTDHDNPTGGEPSDSHVHFTFISGNPLDPIVEGSPPFKITRYRLVYFSPGYFRQAIRRGWQDGGRNNKRVFLAGCDLYAGKVPLIRTLVLLILGAFVLGASFHQPSPVALVALTVNVVLVALTRRFQ